MIGFTIACALFLLCAFVLGGIVKEWQLESAEEIVPAEDLVDESWERNWA